MIRPVWRRIVRQVGGSAFGDADEQQREPAEQDVAADAVLKAVEHRPQEQFAFHSRKPRSASRRFL